MSACISRSGEFSEHSLDDSHTCTRCHVLDEEALRAEVEQLRAELTATRNNRLISAIFGHHNGAPKPFALYRRADETGVSGTGVVALGAEFPDGMVVLRWTSAFPTSVVFHERGIESVEAIHGHGGKTQIVWLSDELESLAEMEQDRDRISALIGRLTDQLEDLSKAQCWRGPRAFAGCDNGGCTHRRDLIAEARAAIAEPSGTEAGQQ